MINYKLGKALNQALVDGLMAGYKEYTDIRRERANNMIISSAYAWVKGNHIEDNVARSCRELGVQYISAKAGMTWRYLQFYIGEESILFIIKNAKYFNADEVTQGKDAKGKTGSANMSYMKKLVNINSHIDFRQVKLEKVTGYVQLSLFNDYPLNDLDVQEIDKIATNRRIDRFYIVTYEIDENQLISQISLFMPNPEDNKAYLIDDLTQYINAENAFTIDERLKNILGNQSDEEYDALSFGIAIEEDEEDIDPTGES